MKPWRAGEAERFLIGAGTDTALFRRAAEAALAEAKPAGDNAFKIELARRVVAPAPTLSSAGPPPARPSSCRRCPLRRLPPFLEFSRMPEIALTQTPIHLRHGSNIGQPLTRRDGVLKVTRAPDSPAEHHHALLLTPC